MSLSGWKRTAVAALQAKMASGEGIEPSTT